jgi:hypothetical protein
MAGVSAIGSSMNSYGTSDFLDNTYRRLPVVGAQATPTGDIPYAVRPYATADINLNQVKTKLQSDTQKVHNVTNH